jgi:hypothetical protein
MNRHYVMLLAILFSSSQAAGLNERSSLAPATQAKMNALLAGAYAQSNKLPKQTEILTRGGAGLKVEIGTSYNAANAPREQNTVVNGDVTVICHHCYGQR